MGAYLGPWALVSIHPDVRPFPVPRPKRFFSNPLRIPEVKLGAIMFFSGELFGPKGMKVKETSSFKRSSSTHTGPWGFISRSSDVFSFIFTLCTKTGNCDKFCSWIQGPSVVTDSGVLRSLGPHTQYYSFLNRLILKYQGKR